MVIHPAICGLMHEVVQHQFYFLGKIKDLLTIGDVNAMTRLVLVNAMYFKSERNVQFKWDATRDAQFRINKVSLLKEHIYELTSIIKCQLRSLNEF